MGFPGTSAGKESACSAGDPSLIPGSGRSPGERVGYPLQYSWASLVVQSVENPPPMQEIWVWSLVGTIPWRRAWQPTPIFLPGESPWTEEPGGLQSTGSQRVRHSWATERSTVVYGGQSQSSDSSQPLPLSYPYVCSLCLCLCFCFVNEIVYASFFQIPLMWVNIQYLFFSFWLPSLLNAQMHPMGQAFSRFSNGRCCCFNVS